MTAPVRNGDVRKREQVLDCGCHKVREDGCVREEHDADYAQASTFKLPYFDEGKLTFRPMTKEEYASMTLES